MATVTGLTAERMLEIEAASVVDGEINTSGHLILTKHDGTTIDAGNALVAVQAQKTIQSLDPTGYTEDTPPTSYPLGVSIMSLSNVETTADWSQFAGKFFSIHTIAYPGGDVTQIAQRLHGSTTAPEQWVRSGNNAAGWSEWSFGIPAGSLAGSAIKPGSLPSAAFAESSLGGSRLAVRTVTYDKMSIASVTPEKMTTGNDGNLIPDSSFVHGEWRTARLGQLPSLGSFVPPATFGGWSFSGAGSPHISGTFQTISSVTSNDQKMSLTSPIPVVAGDIFNVSFWIYGENGPNSAALLGFRWYYPDGTTSLSNGPVVNSFTAPTSWTQVSDTEVVPNGAIAVVPHFEIQAASTTPSGKWHFTKPLMRRAQAGSDLYAGGTWTALASQCTPRNASITDVQVRRFGPIVSIWAYVTLNVSIANNASGDVANTALFTLPSAWWPSPNLNHFQYIGSNGGSGPIAGFAVDPATGDVTLTAIAPGTSLTPGFVFQISGMYWS